MLLLAAPPTTSSNRNFQAKHAETHVLLTSGLRQEKILYYRDERTLKLAYKLTRGKPVELQIGSMKIGPGI